MKILAPIYTVRNSATERIRRHYSAATSFRRIIPKRAVFFVCCCDESRINALLAFIVASSGSHISHE